MGNGSVTKPFAAYAHDRWREVYGTKPPWLRKDYIKLEAAHKAIGDADVARAAWDRFLAETDFFYQGHEPGKFLAQLSRWVPKQPKRHAMLAETLPPEMVAYRTALHAALNAGKSMAEAQKAASAARQAHLDAESS